MTNIYKGYLLDWDCNELLALKLLDWPLWPWWPSRWLTETFVPVLPETSSLGFTPPLNTYGFGKQNYHDNNTYSQLKYGITKLSTYEIVLGMFMFGNVMFEMYIDIVTKYVFIHVTLCLESHWKATYHNKLNLIFE